jgi:thioredoxin 1
MIELTDGNFKKEVLESAVPVVVDFWAPWCSPCKMLAPVLEELHKEYGPKVKFTKLNVDDAPQVAGNYSVMSIPTIIFFDKGKVVSSTVGALRKPDLKKKIDAFLA